MQPSRRKRPSPRVVDPTRIGSRVQSALEALRGALQVDSQPDDEDALFEVPSTLRYRLPEAQIEDGIEKCVKEWEDKNVEASDVAKLLNDEEQELPFDSPVPSLTALQAAQAERERKFSRGDTESDGSEQEKIPRGAPARGCEWFAPNDVEHGVELALTLEVSAGAAPATAEIELLASETLSRLAARVPCEAAEAASTLKCEDLFTEAATFTVEDEEPFSGATPLAEMDLTKLRAGCTFRHMRGCAHTLRLKSARLVHDFSTAPRVTRAKRRAKERKCDVCDAFNAQVIAVDDLHSEENPALYCEQCLHMLHYTADGHFRQDPNNADLRIYPIF